MWFAALGDYRQTWFTELLAKIGSGDAQIRRLMGPDPLPPARPRNSSASASSPTAMPPAPNAGTPLPPDCLVRSWWVRGSNPRTLLPPTDLRRD